MFLSIMGPYRGGGGGGGLTIMCCELSNVHLSTETRTYSEGFGFFRIFVHKKSPLPMRNTFFLNTINFSFFTFFLKLIETLQIHKKMCFHNILLKLKMPNWRRFSANSNFQFEHFPKSEINSKRRFRQKFSIRQDHKTNSCILEKPGNS